MFGDEWVTALVLGTVRCVHGFRVAVLLEDGDLLTIYSANLKLGGEGLP